MTPQEATFRLVGNCHVKGGDFVSNAVSLRSNKFHMLSHKSNPCRAALATCLCLCLTLISTTVFAQAVQVSAGPDELAAWALGLRDSYEEVTAAELASAKAAMQNELDRLDEYLSHSQDGSVWKTNLELQLLADLLAEDIEPDLEQLRAVHDKFTTNLPGLEQPPFRRAAEVLNHYLDLLSVVRLPNPAEHHATQMESLSQSLAVYSAEPTAGHTRSIAQALDWLEINDQSADLVRAVRSKYSLPNLLVNASARFVAAGLTQPLDYTDPIRDRMFGATITGWGHTTGAMDAELADGSDRAVMQLLADGRTYAEIVGRRRSVTVWGDGVTTFHACKTLTLDRAGFVGETSHSRARSNNWPRCISAPPLIKQLAWWYVQYKRREGNQIAACHAEPLINDKLDEEASATIRSANEAYASEFRSPLLRRGAFPPQIDFSTTSQRLNVVILQAAKGQIGAPNRRRGLNWPTTSEFACMRPPLTIWRNRYSRAGL